MKKESKKWMLIKLNKDALLLHYNEDLPMYKKLKRVPNWIVKKLKEGA